MNRFLYLSSFIFLVICGLTAENLIEPIGIIIESKGEVFIIPSGKKYKVSADIGLEIYPGDTLETGNNSDITLVLPDDSTLEFESNNNIIFDNNIRNNSTNNSWFKGFWNIIRNKFLESEKSVLDSDLVGSIRNSDNEEVEIINVKLNSTDNEKLSGELDLIFTAINNELSKLIYSGIINENYKQFKRAEELYYLALELDMENVQTYDLLINLYLKHNQLEKLEDIFEMKRENSW